MNKKELKKLKSVLLTIDDYEDDKTHQLFKLSSKIRKQRYLNRQQALEILKWKSPRPLNRYKLNTEADIKKITKLAFTQKDEMLRMHLLTALHGVKYPAASAILMFYDPKKYPIIDIRVWKVLYKFKLVNTNARGTSFKMSHWLLYLDVIRMLAEEMNLPVRKVEKRLFDYHREKQKGRLYN